MKSVSLFQQCIWIIFYPIYLSFFKLFGVPICVGGNLTEEGEILFFDTVIRYVRMSADWRPLCPPCAQANACAKGRTIKFFIHLLAFQKILLTFAFEPIRLYMKKVPLSSLRKGDFFHLRDDVNSPIWIRGHYECSSRKYSIYPYDDIFRELFRKPTVLVFVESY